MRRETTIFPVHPVHIAADPSTLNSCLVIRERIDLRWLALRAAVAPSGAALYVHHA